MERGGYYEKYWHRRFGDHAFFNLRFIHLFMLGEKHSSKLHFFGISWIIYVEMKDTQ